MTELLKQLDSQALADCADFFKKTEDIARFNRGKVQDAFVKNRVSGSMFAPSTGYGFGDVGRDALDTLFADIVGAEDSLCRAAFFRCGCGQVLPGGLPAILGRCAPSPQPGLCCFSCHSVIAAFRRNISTYHKGVIGAFRPLVLRLTWRRYRVIFLVGRSVPALRPPL